MIPATMANHPNRGRGGPARNPTPAEIRAAREAAELTQEQAAELIHATLRTWQNWEAEGGEESRRMHPGLFELFQLKTKFPEITKVLQERKGKR
jgi:putative transcriptional regulator